MLNIKCDKCNNELQQLGALLFSPPNEGKCDKFHICVSCYTNIVADIKPVVSVFTEIELLQALHIQVKIVQPMIVQNNIKFGMQKYIEDYFRTLYDMFETDYYLVVYERASRLTTDIRHLVKTGQCDQQVLNDWLNCFSIAGIVDI